ncbi:MAG: hypothetical protein NTY77_18800 [Elusimicrobia bacterium]|nr:hypothetical protein [Elusimicrobiota bacterium]
MKRVSSRLMTCGALLGLGLLSAPLPLIGQLSRQPAKVAAPSGDFAGAAINSVLSTVSPQLRLEVVNFLKSPDYDAVRLRQAVIAGVQAQPVLPPASLNTPQAPAGELVARLANPQSEPERVVLVEKMRGLGIALGPFLQEQTRVQLAQAAELMQARLAPEDQQKLQDKMLALSKALGQSAQTTGGEPAASAVQTGGVEENSFARRLARLLPASAAKRRAESYLASNKAAILAIPGVTKVSIGSVLTSPESAEQGVIVRYGLGTDAKSLRASLPKSLDGVEISVRPAYSPKEAAAAYLRAHEAELRTMPGVTEVSIGSVLTSPESAEQGVIVRYGLGADAESLRASMPKSQDGVEFAVIPAYSHKEAAAAYLRAHEAEIRDMPGVTTVGVGSVLTSPYSSEQGVVVRYGLGTDVEGLRARLPKSRDGVTVALIPAYSPKEAAVAYLSAHEAKIRTMPGVTTVSVGSVLTSPESAEQGVVVRYGLGTDKESLRASLPKSLDGVTVALIPAYSHKEAAVAYLRAHEAELLAMPGVAKVSVGRVLTSPYSDEQGVVVLYAMGADAESLRARLPKSLDGVTIALMPAGK